MYIVSFYESGNAQNIPVGWPCQLNQFAPPTFISGLGYQLKTGENSFYNGELTSEAINNDKAGFGIDETQSYMTSEEYSNYFTAHKAEYDAWSVSVKNPSIRETTIKEIKGIAQEKIVEPLGYDSSQSTEFLAKQINMNGRASEIILGIILGTSTSGDQAELFAMKSFFGKVKQIRNYSNLLESYVNSGIDVDIRSGWPD